MRAHLESAERQMPGASRGRLKNPEEFPEPLRYLWQWFLELCFTGRTYTTGGSQPLSNTEIWTWCQLNQVTFETWELRALRLLDAAWLEQRNG